MGSGMPGGCPWAGGPGRFQTLPSTRGFCAPGTSDATGSTFNGSGSHRILIFDRLGSDELTHGAHGEHRLTLIHRSLASAVSLRMALMIVPLSLI